MFIFVAVSSEQKKTTARGPRFVGFVTCGSETKIGSSGSGHRIFLMERHLMIDPRHQNLTIDSLRTF